MQYVLSEVEKREAERARAEEARQAEVRAQLKREKEAARCFGRLCFMLIPQTGTDRREGEETTGGGCSQSCPGYVFRSFVVWLKL
jgi:hypothetical protein